jgi:hypothetical protein
MGLVRMPQIMVEKLRWDKADELMKSLPPEFQEGFKIAFQSENERRESQGRAGQWALSPEDRTYYLARVDATPYLLVGVNLHVNIASFLKITTQFQGFCQACLQRLIEQELVPESKKKNKPAMTMYGDSEEGYAGFRNLQKNLPAGIREIKIENMPGGDWSAAIFFS